MPWAGAAEPVQQLRRKEISARELTAAVLERIKAVNPAGLSFLDIGSDLAGSIRVPAAFGGVYGLRPTAGTVPLAGFWPPGSGDLPAELNYLSTLGPLAASRRT